MRIICFFAGFLIFGGNLALAGWLHENATRAGDWWHDLVGFMELPLFGIGFILWLIMLIVGLALMICGCMKEGEINE